MKKRSIHMISVFIALALVMSCCTAALADGGAGEGTDVWSGVRSIEDVEPIYRFTLDGAEYSLPCEISEFTDNGWNTGVDLDEEMVPGMTSAGCRFTKDINGTEARVTLDLLNANGDAAKASACRVTGVEVSAYDIGDQSIFETVHGVKLGDTLESACAIYGEGTDEDPSSGHLRYSFVEAYEEPTVSLIRLLSFSMDSDSLYLADNSSEKDGTITYIEMAYYKPYDTDTQEISPRPAYLDSYEPPEELGSRVEDMTFMLGGNVYRMPVPASELTAQGLKIDEEAVPGLRNVATLIGRDLDDPSVPTVHIYLQNDSEKMVAAEDTYVEEFTIYSVTKPDDSIDFMLPGGIRTTSTREEVIAAIPALAELQPGDELEQDGFKYRLNTDGTGYYITSLEDTCEIDIYLEEDTVDWITMEAEFPGE